MNKIEKARMALKQIDDTHSDEIPPHVYVGEWCWDEVKTIRAALDEAGALRAERDRLRYGLLNLRAGVYRICDQRGYRDFDADVFPEMFEANAILAQEDDHGSE